MTPPNDKWMLLNGRLWAIVLGTCVTAVGTLFGLVFK